jgi:hypothetical protein
MWNYRTQSFCSNYHKYAQIQKNDEPILDCNNKLSFSSFIADKNFSNFQLQCAKFKAADSVHGGAVVGDKHVHVIHLSVIRPPYTSSTVWYWYMHGQHGVVDKPILQQQFILSLRLNWLRLYWRLTELKLCWPWWGLRLYTNLMSTCQKI